jgi:uncharacterized protein
MRGLIASAVAGAVLAAAPALSQPAAQPSNEPVYVFHYRAGPAWQAGKPMEQQALRPHGAYIKQLLDQGRLVAGGRILDVDGGMAIVRAASLAEAKAMFAADPAITSGVFVGEVVAWRPTFDSRQPLRP